jgi:hypothetical protein
MVTAVQTKVTEPMPVVPIGVSDGIFRIRSAAGELRAVSAEGLLDKTTLADLFGGEAWLRQAFPATYIVVTQRSGGGRSVPIGIDCKAVAFHIARLCVDAEDARTVAVARGTAWTRTKARLRDWLGWRADLAGSAF